ncbi:MAG: 4Fe-4S binding protein, partial [Oscillospiraceae bacterium]
MENYLKLKKANCQNCYKCIRHCPVKSIKFSSNQAHIVSDECILCGQCFVVCPQNAKEIRNDVAMAKGIIADAGNTVVSVAPSFVANFPGSTIGTMEKALKKLGFSSAQETAIGATIVKREYDRLTERHTQKSLITSCCPSINLLIQK